MHLTVKLDILKHTLLVMASPLPGECCKSCNTHLLKTLSVVGDETDGSVTRGRCKRILAEKEDSFFFLQVNFF